MPSFDIIKRAAPSETFRVKSVMGSYDMTTNHTEEHFVGSIELPASWNVGLIVGRSGTGKTTIARELFGDCIVSGYEYTHESILDDMPADASVSEICQALTSVGFASPPSWLKPYAVLSNGEKMRCDLARAILEKREMFVFDEFTSVVDRNVAKIGSLAMQKAIRRGGQKFIAVTCHTDVEEWLMPDWVFDTDTMTFSVKDLAEQKKNRPAIRLDIYETKRKREYWEMFRKYHYLNHELNTAARVFVCFANGQVAGFYSALATPHPQKRNIWRAHRIVVLPDYQGVGIASAMSDAVAEYFKERGIAFSVITSNRSMISGLMKSPRWVCKRVGRILRFSDSDKRKYRTTKSRSTNRITASFEYTGNPASQTMRAIK